MRDRVRSLVYGLTLPAAAFGLIFRRPKLFLLSILPILTTLALAVFGLFKIQSAARVWIESALQSLHWGGWASFAALILLHVALWIGTALIFTFLCGIVASPFSDFLAEQTESYSTPPLSRVPFPGWTAQLRLLRIDLVKSIVGFGVGIMALLFSFVPLLNFFTLALTFLVISFQFISYPQTRRGVSLLNSVPFLWRHFFSCIGFGISLFILFSIPVISIAALPLGVVGGTLLFARSTHNAPFALK